MAFDQHARTTLTHYDLQRFEGETLFARLARTICMAECLPRKELYEAWEVARRIYRRFKGRPILELACGHALLSWCLILLDDSIPRAQAYDIRIPQSAAKLEAALCERWPRLKGRVELKTGAISDVPLEQGPVAPLICGVHACGSLTDQTLDLAIQLHAPVAVMPCCHAFAKNNTGGLEGWLDPSLAIDVTRAARLSHNGYRVVTQSISSDITPKNRILLGIPLEQDSKDESKSC